MLLLRSHGGKYHANQAFFHVSPVSSKFGSSTWRFVRSGKEIVQRNCAERNGTLTKSRIFNVRKNFAKTNQTVKPNLQGSLCKAPNETRT